MSLFTPSSHWSSPFFWNESHGSGPWTSPWRRADQRQACANRDAWANSSALPPLLVPGARMLAIGEIRLSGLCQERTKATLARLYLSWTYAKHQPWKISEGQREGCRRSSRSANTPQTKSTGTKSGLYPKETEQNIKTGHEIFWAPLTAEALASHGDKLYNTGQTHRG